MDIITLALAKNYTNKKIAEVAGGFVYKGAVNYRADLDNIAAEIGHIYTVKYKGTSGTEPWNANFVYGEYEGQNTWIELGPDYDAEISALKTGKQDKLIAGANITIAEDGKTISATGGSGTTVIANPTLTGNEDELVSIQIGDTKYSNLNYHPFPDAFVTNKTLKEFGQSIVNYAAFATGCTWFGGIQCTDLPGGMIQVECKVTAIRDKIDFVRNIAVVEIYSSEVAPFYWTYNTDSWSEGTGLDDWKYMASIDGSKFNSSAAYNEAYDVKVKKVSAAAGSTGWEFYTKKSADVVANPTLAGTEADLTAIQVGDTKYRVPTGGGGEPSQYLLSAEVDSDNHLKINNKLGQQVVDCTVNYTLDNAKVKAVLTEAEKETLLSGVTGTTWIATQTNITALQSGKQDKLTAGDNISITSDNIISAIVGDAKIGKTFTTTVAVGHLAKGTSITADMKIADILYAMLYNETPTTKVKIYLGASTEIPSSIEGLTEEEIEPAVLISSSGIDRTILTGDVRTLAAQYTTIACPKNYKLVDWKNKQSGISLDVQPVIETAEYNIYYKKPSNYDQDLGGERFLLFFEENI